MLEFHHVGTLVEDIDSAMSTYGTIFGKSNVSGKRFIKSQNVTVCFVKTGKNTFLELIQPGGEDSVVYKLLKKGITYYHIAYVVDDYNAMKAELTERNFKALDEFTSEAFKDKRCIFMFSPEGHLIELIEKS